MARYLRKRASYRRTDDFGEAIPAAQPAPVVYEREVVERPVNMAEAEPMAARVVSWIVGAVEILLGLRLILRLIGASVSSPIVRIIYDLSAPLVRPFAAILSGSALSIDTASFEVATLIAMLGYALLGYLVVSLIRALSRRY